MPRTNDKAGQPAALDALDTALLDLLQRDASQPVRALADRLGTSPATCQRRIAQLRASGVLQRQVARVLAVQLRRLRPLQVRNVHCRTDRYWRTGAFDCIGWPVAAAIACYE